MNRRASESDLDLEYLGGTTRGATIYFVSETTRTIIPDNNEPQFQGLIAEHATASIAVCYLSSLLLVSTKAPVLGQAVGAHRHRNAAKGTYSATITGTDIAAASVPASTL